jgi:cob(I)alamin adenosyltransferase
MAKIYTRTGDEGETSLLAGRRVRKDEPRIEAIGCVDELNAALGVVRMELARSGVAPDSLDPELGLVQHRLFNLGAELALAATGGTHSDRISGSDVAELEAAIDRYEADLEPLRAFILPAGAPAAAQLHVARSICRRCERRLVQLAKSEAVGKEVLSYLNRLGDLLFVMARAVNRANRVPDVVWEPGPGNRGAGSKGRASKRK